MILAGAVLTNGCNASAWGGVAAGLSALSAGAAAAPSAGTSTDLLVFGGDGHKTFLGCFNCSEYDASSLFNKYGEYGSAYSSTSIFNKYSDFGSKFSVYSACNAYASDPPVVVDRNGTFYGRLTLNAYVAGAFKDDRVRSWLIGMCG
jgi:hypothetical protein